jgi:hypothetical protein
VLRRFMILRDYSSEVKAEPRRTRALLRASTLRILEHGDEAEIRNRQAAPQASITLTDPYFSLQASYPGC